MWQGYGRRGAAFGPWLRAARRLWLGQGFGWPGLGSGRRAQGGLGQFGGGQRQFRRFDSTSRRAARGQEGESRANQAALRGEGAAPEERKPWDYDPELDQRSERERSGGRHREEASAEDERSGGRHREEASAEDERSGSQGQRASEETRSGRQRSGGK